jgi:hypothetical protein
MAAKPRKKQFEAGTRGRIFLPSGVEKTRRPKTAEHDTHRIIDLDADLLL